MASQGLTTEQCQLLQRFYDEELSAAASVEARQLLERSAAARVYVRALEELSLAARTAGEVAWEQAGADVPAPRELVELATNAGDLAEAPLHELAPMLERFHDGEVAPAEMAFVTALLDERDDAVEYLASLDELREGMRIVGEEMADDVDFGGMWEGIAAEIGADESAPADLPAFDSDHHLVLLQRYFDGEVTDAEVDTVEAWIEADHPEVLGYLAALDEIGLGVTAAVETACEQTNLRGIWSGVEAAIAQEDSGVVSLDRVRDEKQSSGGETSSQTSWFADYKQAIVGALAAAVVLAGMVGLFQDQIFGPSERVIVEKRVVIVESVEYSPGSSVMIDSPMKQVSQKKESDSQAEEEPTVIWLFDSGDNAGEADTPASKDGAEPAESGDDADAGERDSGDQKPSSGQPI